MSVSMTPSKAPPVIVSRCDRLGDLVLSLPVLGFLRDAGVEERILHCAGYAQDIGEWALHNELCTQLWVTPRASSIPQPVPPARADRPAQSWGLCLHYARASLSAFRYFGLKNTLAPRTKLPALWQFKYTVAQHRSRVEKSEMEYNVDLARVLIERLRARGFKVGPPEFRGLPALTVPPAWRAPRPSPDIVVVLSNQGSATNASVEQYLAALAERQRPGDRVEFLASGLDAAAQRTALAQILPTATLVDSFGQVRELIAYLAGAREVIASSTGPLHIAHAAGVAVTGFYPRVRVQSFARWRPHGYWHEAPVKFIEI